MPEKRYELYTPTDVRAVVDSCDQETPTGARDGAFVFLLWCTGLRIAEACDLKPDALDRRRGTVWVACGKGGKSRSVVTPRSSRPELWQRLDRWARFRESHAWTDSPLFCNLHGQRIDESYMRKTMGTLAARANLTCRFHPHGLRHTFAASMHLAGVPLDVIQRQLGHNDLAITGAYLRRIAPEVVHSIMSDFSLE
jgi:site-specific recombinase XerD